MKRLLAVVLTLAMALSCGGTAFASEVDPPAAPPEPSYSITLAATNPVSGQCEVNQEY